MQVGETSFASQRTEYEVRTGSGPGGGPRQEAVVYEGEIIVYRGSAAPGSPTRSQTLTQGFKLLAGKSTEAQIVKVEAVDFKRTASLSAQMEVGKDLGERLGIVARQPGQRWGRRKGSSLPGLPA